MNTQKPQPFAPFGKQIVIDTGVSVLIVFQCKTSERSFRLTELLNEAYERWINEM